MSKRRIVYRPSWSRYSFFGLPAPSGPWYLLNGHWVDGHAESPDLLYDGLIAHLSKLAAKSAADAEAIRRFTL